MPRFRINSSCRNAGILPSFRQNRRSDKIARSGIHSIQHDLLANADDVHSGFGVCAAGDHGFFFVAVLDPDLTFQTIAVPAKFAVGDGFHVEILQAAEDGVVFGHAARLTANGNVDQLIKWFEYFGFVHLIHFTEQVKQVKELFNAKTAKFAKTQKRY